MFCVVLCFVYLNVEWMNTSHAVAQTFFEENKKLNLKNYFTFFRLSNPRLESSNGIIRGLRCDNNVGYETGKGIQRFYLCVKYDP